MGNRGWSYQDVLPYFKKLEDYHKGPNEYHGTGGPVTISDPVSPNILTKQFMGAVKELGLPTNDDFNGEKQEGYGLFQRTIRKGKRCSTSLAYIKPILQRPNLTIISTALTTSLVFENGKVIGVEYEKDKKNYIEHCSREVILSAGAINSPQLLLLSGVGPADELTELGIKVNKDLPGVGKNLQDHPFVMLVSRTPKNITLDEAETGMNYLKYLLFKKGPLTSTVAEAGGFMKSRQEIPAPDLQLFFGPAFMVNHGLTPPGGYGFSMGPCLVKPRSHGELTLKSKDPHDAPNINPRVLTDPQDMAAMVEGYKVAAKLQHTKSFAPYIQNYFAPLERLNSVGEIMQFIRENAEMMYHPTGTCKMGNDPMSVVDSQLRVHGVPGLRVVDASIMPSIVRGNTNAPTIMIAEKAADMIKGRG